MTAILVVIGAVVLGLFAALPALVIRAFFAMLFIGGVHADVFPQVPALGFIQTVLVVGALTFLFPTSTNVDSKSS